MRKFILALGGWLLILGLAGCLPAQAETVDESPTPSQTPEPSATATIQWFPATATPSPAPTINVSPTLDLRQGVADPLFEDDFSVSSLWQTASSDDGSIAFGNNVLTLAVKRARMSLISMRSAGALTDFYLQITMTPSLCRGQDVFGVLVRATSNYNYYRFLVSCNGQLRAERVKNGVMVVIQDWFPTGQIMPGSSQPLQLGLMGLKSEFRVFVNDVFQYYVRDPSWAGGGVGVYAHSAADTPLTVNFSDLKVWSLQPERVTPIPTITPTVTPTKRS